MAPNAKHNVLNDAGILCLKKFKKVQFVKYK